MNENVLILGEVFLWYWVVTCRHACNIFEIFLHSGACEARGGARHGQPNQRLWLFRMLCQDKRWRKRGVWDGHQGCAASEETGQKVWLSAVIENCRREDVSQQPRRRQSREGGMMGRAKHSCPSTVGVSDWYWDIMSDKPRETNGKTSETSWKQDDIISCHHKVWA